MKTMNDEQFQVVVNKLDLIHKALALNLTKDLEFKNKVTLLRQTGFTESDIIKLLGSNRARVHSILRRIK